jgi:UDP-N-acetyl-2-amino-2-deoxyglucuronate dehydrogenase
MRIKFSILGFGHIGKRHAAIIAENTEAELVSIIDVDFKKVPEALSLGYKIPFYSNLNSFFENDKDKTDVLCICTPNGLHSEHAVSALEHKYHVVIEKPMALTKADCEAIIFKSLQVNKQVFVVKQNRYSSPSRWLNSLVKNNILGKIYMVQINCYWNRDNRYYKKDDWKGSLLLDGGPLFTQFSHFVDIMYWVFGDIKNIHSLFNNFNHHYITDFEDSGVVNFEFVSGGIGCINFSTSCWDKNMESSITVLAENGCLKIGGQYMNEVEYCHIKNYEMPELEPVNLPNDYGAYKGSAANHHLVISNVVETLNGRGTITTNAMEGMKVVEIIERIYTRRKQKDFVNANVFNVKIPV